MISDALCQVYKSLENCAIAWFQTSESLPAYLTFSAIQIGRVLIDCCFPWLKEQLNQSEICRQDYEWTRHRLVPGPRNIGKNNVNCPSEPLLQLDIERKNTWRHVTPTPINMVTVLDFGVLACKHLLISTEHKLQMRLIFLTAGHFLQVQQSI